MSKELLAVFSPYGWLLEASIIPCQWNEVLGLAQDVTRKRWSVDLVLKDE